MTVLSTNELPGLTTGEPAGIARSHRLLSRRIRQIVLERSWRAGAGHIGSALSVADMMAVLFGGAIKVLDVEDPERDRFVLSKGHAALALYAALYETERLSGEQLDSFCVDGSPLATHPEHVVSGIDFSTGSLGQGLSFAVGAALAARMQGSPRRAFALLSDAECNEGSIWEAVMFAAHHRLGNMIALVDVNGQQALGYTRDVLDLAPLSARWHAFGWDVHDVDGHDVEQLRDVLDGLDRAGLPHVLLAHTTFGKGVAYMENAIPWHYRSMSDQQYELALCQLEAQAPASGAPELQPTEGVAR
jgi:transketolase